MTPWIQTPDRNSLVWRADVGSDFARLPDDPKAVKINVVHQPKIYPMPKMTWWERMLNRD